jgi:phosphatidylinositol glycan class O
VTVDEVVPLVLLAQLAFFASGHQATFVSLQWKAAFVLSPSMSFALAGPFMLLNTLGPTALVVLAVPLLGIWNVAPLAVAPDASTTSSPGPERRPTSAQEAQEMDTHHPRSQARVAVLGAVRAALGVSLYFGSLLLGSALSAAWLRRHLMVWKVFAPRYMIGAVELLCVDFVMSVGLWLGVGRIVGRITRMFALPTPTPSAASVTGEATEG